MSDEKECRDKFDRPERISQLTAIEDDYGSRRDEQERHFVSASPPQLKRTLDMSSVVLSHQ